MLDLSFKQVGPNTYQKWNATQRIRTTIEFDNARGLIHVRHEQPKQDIEDILDLNVKLANDFQGYPKNDDLFLATRVPLTVRSQIEKMCGKVRPGDQLDEQKFKSIMNDPDYRKLKCIPGKL